jgi:uncharacterized protein YbaA (DUF1428 family)
MSNLPLLSKQAEKHMLECVETIIEDVNNGTDPTDALIKAAKDKDLSEPYMRRIGEAYNNSRTIYEFNEKQGAARGQPFSIININKAVDEVFPKTVEKAASVSTKVEALAAYSNEIVDFVKQAHSRTLLGAEINFEKKADNVTAPVIQKQTKSEGLDSFEFIKAAEDFREAADTARTSIRQTVVHTPFYKLEAALLEEHGEKCAEWVDMLWNIGELQKVGQRRATLADLDFTNQTYSDFYPTAAASVESLISAASKLHKYAKLNKPKKVSNDAQHIKESAEKRSLFSATGNIISTITDNLNSGKLKEFTNQKQKQDRDTAIAALMDPAHRDRLRAIQAQMMLHDFLSNDDIISQHPTDKVVELFNELYEVAPEAALKPLIMRDMLRRALDKGGLEALEVGQLGELNKDIGEMNVGTPVEDIEKNLLADPTNLQRDLVAQEKQIGNKSTQAANKLSTDFKSTLTGYTSGFKAPSVFSNKSDKKE